MLFRYCSETGKQLAYVTCWCVKKCISGNKNEAKKVKPYALDTPNSRSFNEQCSVPSLSNFTFCSFIEGMILEEAACFSTSTAQLQTTIPITASTIPSMFFSVISKSKSSQPIDRTHTVFMWPKTWKDTAEKRPMQRYWLMLQNTAKVQETRIKIYTTQ